MHTGPAPCSARHDPAESGRVAARAAFALALVAAAPGATLAAGVTERVSVASGGRQANDDSSFSSPAAVSADGRFVAFESHASNLVPGDTNRASDIFVRDRRRGVTVRVNVGAGGVQGLGGESYDPSVSADGRFVAFDSLATNLVPGDTNRKTDVFVRDRRAGVTRRPSVGTDGIQGDGLSNHPALSADGRYVAFSSSASNLVPRDTNYVNDVFVRTRVRSR